MQPLGFFQPSGYDFEYSELLLYQNMVLRESGRLQAALTHLEENDQQIANRLQLIEIRGTIIPLYSSYSQYISPPPPHLSSLPLSLAMVKQY